MGRGRALLAALAGGTLALTGCAQLPWAPATPSEAPATTSSAPELPTIAAMVKTKTPSILNGTVPTTVIYEVPEDVAVVATLDCATCTGAVTLSSNASRKPLLSAKKAPAYAEFLISRLRYERSGTLTVEASGPWTLTLASWKDLPAVADVPEVVKGARVLRLSGKSQEEYEVTFRPADKDDQLAISTFPMPKTNTGVDLKFAKEPEMPITLPGGAVVAVSTRGKWSLTRVVTTPVA